MQGLGVNFGVFFQAAHALFLELKSVHLNLTLPPSSVPSCRRTTV